MKALLRWAMLLLLVVSSACPSSGPPVEPILEPEVRVQVEQRRVSAGEPVAVTVEIREPEGVTVLLEEPTAEGLQTVLDEEQRQELGGGRLVLRHYSLTGDPGSYIITAGEAKVLTDDGDDVLPTPALFVDVGVQGPSSELQDIHVPAPQPPSRWLWWFAALLAVLGLVGLGVWGRRRRTIAQEPAPREPPDRVALREWEAALSDPDTDDHGRALALSEVFRRYLEAVYDWPATALTTEEIRQRLYDGGFSAALLDRARRMLVPMDLLKFARRGGGATLFRELDEDFHVFLRETRPPTAEPTGQSMAGRGADD